MKSRILKTPCYYADLATRYGTPLYEKFGFRNLGLTRMSFKLGGRNLLSTAITPLKFPGDKGTRLIAAYDAGRPYEFDAESLEIKTPIGSNKEWIASTPAFLQMPFPMIQSTAHPAFDPLTQEMFTVNFTRSSKNVLACIELLDLLARDEKNIEQELEKNIHQSSHLRDKAKLAEIINLFFRTIDVRLRRKGNKRSRLLHWLLSPVQRNPARKRRWQKRILHVLIRQMRFFATHDGSMEDLIYLLKWKGEGAMQRWKVIDQQGEPVSIAQCIHQMAVTENYIVLADAAFSLGINLFINNPFPKNHEIDRFIRDLTTIPMQPFTSLFIIRRSDLQDHSRGVKAQKIDIPLEGVHFMADYQDTDDLITLYMGHNSAACLANGSGSTISRLILLTARLTQIM